MRNIKFLLIALSALFSVSGSAKELSVDLNHSSVLFEAMHFKISKIPGRFTDFSGQIDLNEQDFTQTKINFTIQIASVNTAVTQRDDHLRTADFFDVAKYPTATFRSTSITKSGENWLVTGDLTIRDVTKSITWKVKELGVVLDPMMKTNRHVFRASAEMNRKEFGVSYGDDALVSDIIKLKVNLEAMAPGKI